MNIIEHVLVVPRETIISESWQGLKQESFDTYIAAVHTHGQYLPRPDMEADPRYKQIIPYLIFTYNDTYFLMQRKSTASEQRLQNKFSLGIGGHIRQTDVQGNDIFAWAAREFHEEVNYTGNLVIEPLGIINDDSTPVGQVHIGFALLLRGDSPDIHVKSELKSGFLATKEECLTYGDRMETWSTMVLAYLK